MEYWQMLLIVCPLIFLGGFIDSVAGGGGLITLPTYLMVGIPPHVAAGTNKIVNGIGTTTAAVGYFRKGKIKLNIAIPAAIGALAGSSIGAQIAMLLSDRMLKSLMLIALPLVAIFLMVKRDFGLGEDLSDRLSPRRRLIISLLIGLIVGCYDGLVGPGTGTFMIMGFTALMSLDLISASGCAKVGNLSSNIAAAVVFFLNGKIMWSIVIPAAVCNAIGGWCGSIYAVRGGSKKIRGMIFVVLGMLFIKMIWDLAH